MKLKFKLIKIKEPYELKSSLEKMREKQIEFNLIMNKINQEIEYSLMWGNPGKNIKIVNKK